MSNKNADYLFRFIVIGQSMVGKTCLVDAYCGNGFHTSHITTIGIDFKITKVTRNKKTVKLHIWDTAGQERFRSLTSEYMRGSNGIIIVYDVANLKTLDESIEIYNELAEKHENLRPVVVLVGSKYDLVEDEFKENPELKQDLIKEINIATSKIKIDHFDWSEKERKTSTTIKYFFTSAVTEFGLKDVFNYMVDRAIENHKSLMPPPLKSLDKTTESKTNPTGKSLKTQIEERKKSKSGENITFKITNDHYDDDKNFIRWCCTIL
ncbi:MAG: GTP-binding protein YPTC1 [Edafosvirus sp.]|uniref:GTP-binding protein YPTC1 n=1 Tax=Edafosvirus sp. TaxID=2487765 RepID=A0A3G4ZWD3_9VIRU|nr:MAG: GTP-binding protein YPTC1 [Edafosvirus sp.]